MESFISKSVHRFERVYGESGKKIFNFIKKRVISREDAEDITQDVFLKVLRKIDDFRDTGVKIESWVFTIAKNAIIDYQRRNSKQKSITNAEEIIDKVPNQDQDPLAGVVENEDEVNLFKAISSLPDREQYLVYYKYFADMPVNEIAEKCNMTVTNVGTRLHRIRKKLQNLLI